jgi:hypothetical protein
MTDGSTAKVEIREELPRGPQTSIRPSYQSLFPHDWKISRPRPPLRPGSTGGAIDAADTGRRRIQREVWWNIWWNIWQQHQRVSGVRRYVRRTLGPRLAGNVHGSHDQDILRYIGRSVGQDLLRHIGRSVGQERTRNIARSILGVGASVWRQIRRGIRSAALLAITRTIAAKAATSYIACCVTRSRIQKRRHIVETGLSRDQI